LQSRGRISHIIGVGVGVHLGVSVVGCGVVSLEVYRNFAGAVLCGSVTHLVSIGLVAMASGVVSIGTSIWHPLNHRVIAINIDLL
jgi:hypothetical protein